MIGFTLGYLGLIISNVIGPQFIDWRGITIVSTVFGLNEVGDKVDKKIDKIFQ